MSSLKTQLRTVRPVVVETLLKDLHSLTADALDAIAETGEIVLVSHVPYRDNLNLPALPGGWNCIYTGKRHSGATGNIILLPKDAWNRKLWNRGQIKKAVGFGMTEFQAALFMASHIKYKLEMMQVLAQLLTTPRLANVYKTWNPHGSADDNLRWEARNYIKDGMSAKRRLELMNIWRELTEPSDEQLFAAQRLLDNIRPADEPAISAEALDTVQTQPAEPVAPAKPKRQLTEAQRAARRERNQRKRQRLREAKDAEGVVSALTADADHEPVEVDDPTPVVPVELSPLDDELVDALREADPTVVDPV